jgi:hypothetical protein
MKCKHVQQQLLDYSEELLDPKTRSSIKTHLAQCPGCEQELREIERTIHLLQSVPLQEPPETFWTDFTTSVMGQIKKAEITPPVTERLFFFFPRFKMAAALAVAMILVVVGSILFYYTGFFHQQEHEPTLVSALTTPNADLETVLSQIAPEELMQDILDAEFALIEGGTMDAFNADHSDEMLYFLISTLTDKEKDLFLAELYKMK